MGISYHSEGFLVKFNPSLLKKFQECNLQYKLAQEHPDVVELQSAAASFGTLVHKCIEMYLQGRSVDDCVDFFKLVWDDPSVMGITPDYYHNNTSHESYREKGIKAITEYHEEFKWSSREVIGTEVRFCIPFGNHLLSGIIDNLLYDKSQDILLICDLKTGARPNKDNLHASLQFTSYDWATRKDEFWTGYPPEIDKYWGVSGGSERLEQFRDTKRLGVWFDLRNAKEYPVGQRTEQDFLRMLRLCDQIELAIERDVYVPTITGDTCKFCAYKDVCSVYVSSDLSGEGVEL